MRVIVSGGGTGGHIYPALALIKRLQARHLLESILYVGTKTGLEQKIITQAQIPFEVIDIQGFKRKLTWENVTTVKLFLQSISRARKIIQKFQPDIVVGTGGYVSSAVVYAAHRQKIPTIIHEQNSIAGLTNKFLGHFVDKIAYAFPEAATQFSEKKKLVFTGNPRAQEVAHLKPNKRLQEIGLRSDLATVLIFGGSRGASPINRAVIQLIPQVARLSYQVLFVTGKVHYEKVQKQLSSTLPANVQILPYIDDMPAILPDVALVVGRSGATSIAELTALGIPAIFIPSPYVTHDHQTKNAQALVEQHAAVMIPESELTATRLLKQINQLMTQPQLLAKMQQRSQKIGVVDASDRMIKVMLELIAKAK